MLANVTERTHEIGVRRAFGARRREIVAQFAVEATALCLAGGLAGVPVGALAALIVAIAGGWPVAISAASIAIALALAAAVGLGFGIYPARVAARLDPAAALRAE
jgi:putative ABC transport system permease protein